ncbi:serine-rich adhesin for platelets isoform X2 [Teleopsis dalmanni]|uniref:serine-rich adhesin for platelets isoform X2 n=1 Tax=Teleopsis dalmanni TaxID=139649 RepID=UPI0018CE79F1|nr:serine-rich adhesin for platelets isoform X2 [Teleopsis dalmanni]
MKACAYKNCCNFNNVHVPGSSSSFTLFQFPKDVARRRKWLKLAQVPEALQNSTEELYLCSEHFDKKFFSMTNRRRMLIGEAIPFPVTDYQSVEEEEQHSYVLFEDAHIDEDNEESKIDVNTVDEDNIILEAVDDDCNVIEVDVLEDISQKRGTKRKDMSGYGTHMNKRRHNEAAVDRNDTKSKINIISVETTLPSKEKNSITTAQADTACSLNSDVNSIDKQNVDTFIFKGEEYVQMRKEYYVQEKTQLIEKLKRDMLMFQNNHSVAVQTQKRLQRGTVKNNAYERQKQVDDPPSLPVGTEVSAKYKGAFCEAKVSKVVRNIKVKVAYKHGLGSGIVSDDAIKATPGQLRVGAIVEVRHPDRKEYIEATVTKIQDCSQYTVVFDDGDITTLRRTALCLKSGRHFNESETLDQLPLTHPEHFGNPVVGGRRGRRRGHTNDDSSEEEDESETKEVINEKEENIGKVVCVETESKKKDKEKWFPGLVVSPTAQATARIRVKDEYLVRSFKDGRYYTVPKKEATEFTREAAAKQDGPAVQAALEYLDSNVLPAHWDRDALFGLSNSTSEEDEEVESDSSDDEPREEKDHFVAQLYKYMDDRGTPLNKVPSIQSKDVDLYRLFRAVQKRGGYNRVTSQNQWKPIAIRLGFTPVTVSVTNLVKQAYKKFLQPYGEFNRKLGCSMLMTPRNSNRSKGRSLVRASSVASPKPAEPNKDVVAKSAQNTNTPSTSTLTVTPIASSAPVPAVVTQSAAEESENTSESSLETTKKKRKTSVGGVKVKSLVEKFEEKNVKDEADVPLSKIKAAVAASRSDEKEKETKEIVKEVPSTSTPAIREPSPTGSVTSNKKEKIPRKPQVQNEEKRGKRKKDEIIYERVEAGDFYVEIGDKLKVYYTEKKDKSTYEAKVIEIVLQKDTPMYLVHYTGWNTRYDEWVPRERIAENITKGYKQKGRPSGNGGNASIPEKTKENPPKPPTAASVALATSHSSISTSSLSTTVTKTPSTAKRGRGRSDSLPPRSTTPSSVASNSSRTKSPAASSVKRRPTRVIPNSARRTSTNVSDVSIPSESDTDSDEPVKRPTRNLKEQSHKMASNMSNINKSPNKAKRSVSAANSQTESEDDQNEENETQSSSLKINSNNSSNSSKMGPKGRDYDLNEIRSELKGFQDLKSPSPPLAENIANKDISSNTSENELDVQSNTSAKDACNEIKDIVAEIESKVEPLSETDSCADDDSQSSDKTTTLENMTEKFQQKINADKQRSLEKQSLNKGVSSTRVVEKIIKESLAEKRQESLKAKPQVKDEKIKLEEEIDKFLTESVRKIDEDEDDCSTSSTQVNETKSSILAPARFGNTSGGKYTSVIVEKPLSSSVGKKNESVVTKKNDTNKKVIDKEIINIEPPAACSPSSSSSSSSAFSTSSVSTRSLPDMSKLDISGSSSSASLYSSIISQEAKFSQNISKPISPDIYEFKDPEPFEFEIRKSPLVLSSSSMSLNSTAASSSTANSLQSSSRKQTQKQNQQDQSIQNPMSTLMNRKKRGSPMKDSNAEKSKLHKIEEKASTIVSDSKGIHNTSIPANTSQTVSNATKTSPTQNKAVAIINAPSHVALLAPPPPNAGNQKVEPATHTPFDVLRKSPSFNLNKNTLNEELAQTLQETARALTDALPPPTTPGTPVTETTPTKIEPSTSASAKNQSTTKVTSPKFVTPPKQGTNTKPVVGSPFLETRKDIISNVFETSLSVASSSNTESKDNKFDLKNAKILLSASAGAFDLQPPNFENKPTSIADKVLKAISQKKEEVESKNKETKEDCDKDKITEPCTSKETEAAKQKLGIITVSISTNNSNEGVLSGTEFLLQEPLKINTDLPTTSTSLLSGGKDFTGLDKVLQSPVLCKNTTLISPEPRLSMFETIGKKNTDLTETIQKLECAIQKKHIVSTVTITPTAPVTDHFSDDSTDSTDSRLVIEDVSEEPAELQKSPISGHPTDSRSDIATLKIDDSKKILSNIVVPEVTIQAATPLKLISPGKQVIVTSTVTVPANAVSTNFASKLQAASTVLFETKPAIESATTSVKSVTQAQPHIVQQVHILPTVQIVNSHKPNAVNSETNVKEAEHSLISTTDNAFKGTTLQSQTQRAATVVPIVLPDIPVSVVVASSAVPSVVAAAQAAAAAAVKNNTQKQTIMSGGINVPSSSSVPTVTSVSSSTFAANSASLKTFETAAAVRNVSVLKTMPLSIPPVSQQNNTFVPSNTVTGSGFYLDARTELRPDDGLKLIVDNMSLEKGGHLIELRGDDYAASTSASITADAQNEAINLLCEETIPGSPVPSFGGKDEPIPTTQVSIVQTIAPNNKMDYNIIADMPSTSGAQNIQATGSVILVSTSSSTPDSVSQDDSSEDLKKNAEIDEVSPRKRRRTRQQSEISAVSEVHQKRRKYTTSKRTAAGSDSDDNSDNVSNSRQQIHHQAQLPPIQAQNSSKSFPYNFLVELDSSLSSEQSIGIIQKQISDLRKRYLIEKSNLASIDRRRKKLRRREREKKQLQNQQVKIQS